MMLVPLERSAASSHRRVCILGSTGSIGQSAVRVIREHPEQLSVTALVAGSSWQTLLAQIEEFKVKVACLADPRAASQLRAALAARMIQCEVLSGEDAACDLAADSGSDIVLAAVVGSTGLPAVLSAIRAGKRVALANKESLVMAGELVTRTALESKSAVVPVDSEHSAIFQVLQAVQPAEISKLILTASGGPFLSRDAATLSSVTPEEAVRHPRWNMGPKISIDSSTLVNKALELIEAHFLFGTAPKQIEVIIHPQSIIHSAIETVDGSVLAQLGVADMAGPIAYALRYPDTRLDGVIEKLDLCAVSELQFMRLEDGRFPAVALARSALESGGTMPAVFNLANEEAVSAFLARSIRFDQIIELIQYVTSKIAARPYRSLEDLNEVAREVRATSRTFVERYRND